MSRHQRTKGKRGELELAATLTTLFPGFSYRRRTQYRGATVDGPDLESTDGLAWEAKRAETWRADWLAAALAAAPPGQPPALAHRRNGGRWTVTFYLDDLPKIIALLSRRTGNDADT